MAVVTTKICFPRATLFAPMQLPIKLQMPSAHPLMLGYGLPK
jgi:hypothetical protein